jgi:hypothetical protein
MVEILQNEPELVLQLPAREGVRLPGGTPDGAWSR